MSRGKRGRKDVANRKWGRGKRGKKDMANGK